MFWLGVDGGGTKTSFSLYDDGLSRVDRLLLPTCHYAQVGFAGMEGVLSQGVAWARRRISDSACANGKHDLGLGVGFALCGYGEGAETTARIDDTAGRVAAGHPFTVVNDVEAAWAAGLECEDGIAVIAGTGSIAFGACRGKTLRCGGWDYELGDEGSGGWLGKEALRLFTRQADGREERGALYDLVRERLSLDEDFAVIGWAQAHYAERSSVSVLAPLMTEAALRGDESAREAFVRAAREEADMVNAIARRLFNDPMRETGTIPVTYVGGTFSAGPLILDPLARFLDPPCRLVAPAHEPDLGPVLILKHELGR